MQNSFHVRRRRALAAVVACLSTGAAPSAVAQSAKRPIVQPVPATPEAFMQRAHALADEARRRGDGGYGAVIVKEGRIVGEAGSRVVTHHDPTAHGEIEAIRDACRRLGTTDLSGARMYGNARACPMCESGAYWARLERLLSRAASSDGGAPRLGRC